ncbi:MAG: CARDB domain-containing protein, partial [Nitrospirota bacterium]
MNAYNVQIKYYIDETAPFDIATATIDIPANSTTTNEITWRTNKAGENLPITVFVDPFNSFTELSEGNNKAFTYLTVSGSTEPNLITSYKDMTIIPNPANERGNVNISALVKNEGFSPASDINVNFYKGAPGVDGVLLGSQTILSLHPDESSRVSVDWMNIMESGERIIYVQVDPDNQIREIREDDNDAFTILKIFSLPDLTISTNSIIFTPSAPKEGDTVSINVTIQNKGEQGASNVPVKAYEGNTLIGSQIIPSISGNYQAGVSFSYDTTGKSGVHQITVIIDPDNAIIEQSDDNNQASRTFGVQDANLWLTEKYISPNGDGVKDSTQFFFRLNTPQTVKIVVVNEKGETVRTFSGVEFENILGGNVTWDGLDDNGMVVDDGHYQIKTIDLNNKILGSLLVIVDNNRSSLTDAVGTKYLLNNNLTCMLPDIGDENWDWLPDESGIVFSIEYSDSDAPEYPAGVYTVAPDGEDILRLIPRDWTEDNPDYMYYYFHHFLSPDGEKIAFTFWKYDRKDNTNTTELWIADIDGRNLTLLEKSDIYYSIEDMKWSPDGKYVAYTKNRYAGSDELWIININNLEKTKIGLEAFNSAWSPDSNKIAYTNVYYDANYNQVLELWITDTSGNDNKIATFTNLPPSTLEWLSDQKIFLSGGYYGNPESLWLIDTSGAGNHIELSDNSHDFILSPDKKNIAFTEYDDKASVKISDDTGNVSILYESPYIPLLGEISSVNLSNLVWSYDGKKLAFVDITYKAIEKVKGCPPLYEPHLIIFDTSTKSKKIFKVAEARCDYTYECAYSGNPACYIDEGERFESVVSFFQDNIYILLNPYFVINSETGEQKGYLPLKDLWWEPNIRLSPLGRYITYYRFVDPSSVCYGRGWQDLWALSSLLNLTDDLRVTEEKSAVILKGIAADLNFDGYMLEYADAKNLTQWNLISPPSNIPVINDVFTTWVPPYEGTFYVRLTVWDKAGNVAWDRKRVSWGIFSSITNIYKTVEIFSPNGDDVKDSVELHYRVLEPVHLEFYIYAENNNLIKTFYKDYTAPAEDYITWDGRDEFGKIVPDGKYKIKIFDYEFFVEVDSAPPDVNIALSPINQNPKTLELYVDLLGHAVDNKLKNWIIEYGEGDNPQEWYELMRGEDMLIGKDDKGNPVLDP